MFYLPRYLVPVVLLFTGILALLDHWLTPVVFSWYSISLGFAALVWLFAIFLYFLIVQFKLFKYLGSYKWWVNFHIFCAFFLWSSAVFHSGLRINTLFGWFFTVASLFVLVTGLLGQYFFIKIPRTQTGFEEDKNEIIQVAEDHALRLLKFALKDPVLFDFLDRMDHYIRETTFSRKRNLLSMVINDYKIYRAKRRFMREMNREQSANPRLSEYRSMVFKRITVEQKIANLSISKDLLRRWKYFHYSATTYFFLLVAIHVFFQLGTIQFARLPLITGE